MIRPVTREDAMFLYECLRVRLTEPDTNISHTVMPNWTDHLHFIEYCPYLEYNIIMENDLSIGYLYLTKIFEVGVFIMPEWRGRGISKTILLDLMNRYHATKLLANISPANERSRRLFEKLGFEKIQETFAYSIADKEAYKGLHHIMTGE